MRFEIFDSGIFLVGKFGKYLCWWLDLYKKGFLWVFKTISIFVEVPAYPGRVVLRICLFVCLFFFCFVFFILKLLQYCNYIIIVMQIKLMLLLLLRIK